MTAPDHAALTIERLLREGADALAGSQTPRLDARVLMRAALKIDEAGLIARGQEPVAPTDANRYRALVSRRAKGEPVAYILGEKEFWGLTFEVSPHVLIPRPDTECLVEAVARARRLDEPWTIVDLGVGSGAILCALLTEFPQARGIGVDRSEAAAKIARRNALRLGLGPRASFLCGDWLDAVGGPLDIIVSNPPYIDARDRSSLPHEVAAYEPGDALFAGERGLEAFFAILARAPAVLSPAGLLAFEVGDGAQARAARRMAARNWPTAAFSVFKDLAGRPRAFIADLRSREERD